MGLFDFFADTTKQKSSSQNQSTSTTQNNALNNPWAQNAFGNYFNQFSGPTASAPVNQYMLGAGNNQMGATNNLIPGFNAASGVASTGLSPSAYQPYMSQYTQQVIDPMIQSFGLLNQQNEQGIRSRQTAQGALGNSTNPNAYGQYLQQVMPQQQSAIAQQYDKGFNNAQGLAAQSANLQLQGAGALGQLTGAQSGANTALGNIGNQIWNANYQNSMLPYQLQNMGLAGLNALGQFSGTTQNQSGSSSGSSTQRSYNPFESMMTGASFLTGLPGQIGSMIPSWANGGRINGDNDGGGVLPAYQGGSGEDVFSRFTNAMGVVGKALGGEVANVPSLGSFTRPGYADGQSVFPPFGPDINDAPVFGSGMETGDGVWRGDNVSISGTPNFAFPSAGVQQEQPDIMLGTLGVPGIVGAPSDVSTGDVLGQMAQPQQSQGGSPNSAIATATPGTPTQGGLASMGGMGGPMAPSGGGGFGGAPTAGGPDPTAGGAPGGGGPNQEQLLGQAIEQGLVRPEPPKPLAGLDKLSAWFGSMGNRAGQRGAEALYKQQAELRNKYNAEKEAYDLALKLRQWQAGQAQEQQRFKLQQDQFAETKRMNDPTIALKNQELFDLQNPEAVFERRRKQAASLGMDPASREYREFVATGDFSRLGTQKDSLEQQVAARKLEAERLGMKQDHPAYQSFVLTGKLPREDAQPLTATDKKFIEEADEKVAANQEALTALGQGKELSEFANSGYFASSRAALGRNLPDWLIPDQMSSPSSSSATAQYENVIIGNALSALKSTFGAAPTEGERQILMDLQASVSLPHADRVKIIDRAIDLANKRLERYQQKAAELRNKDYYKPEGDRNTGIKLQKPIAQMTVEELGKLKGMPISDEQRRQAEARWDELKKVTP